MRSINLLIPIIELVDKFMVLINEIKNDFDLEECVKYLKDKITGNIFNKGVFPEIDEVCSKISECHANFDSLTKTLSIKLEGVTDFYSET